MLDPILYKIGFYLINIDFMLCLICAMVILFSATKWGRPIFIGSFLLLVLIQITNLYEWPPKNLKNTYTKKDFWEDDIERFILLGGSYKLNKSTNKPVVFSISAGRFIDFLRLAFAYPTKKIVFTGTPLEAEITHQYFKDFQINENRIIIENQSKNTAIMLKIHQKSLKEYLIKNGCYLHQLFIWNDLCIYLKIKA